MNPIKNYMNMIHFSHNFFYSDALQEAALVKFLMG